MCESSSVVGVTSRLHQQPESHHLAAPIANAFPTILCNRSAFASSDVVEFRAGFRETENICGSQLYADVRRAVDEGSVFAVHADSAYHPPLPRLSFLHRFGSRDVSAVTDFFRVGKRGIPACRFDASRRAKVSEILERQNRAWGASPKALANIERLRRGALAAVTGQQVGLFGGPLFSIFKALTAVKLAEQATVAGVDCVPVFWLATEDHDLAEVNHVALVSEHGLPESFAVESRAVADAPVGAVKFGAEIEPVVERAATLLGDSEVTTW